MKKIAILVLLFFLYPVAVHSQDATTYHKVGDKAPAFICRTLDGQTINIARLRGKIILINFFATWCGPCNQELPVLQADIWNKYKNNKKFVLIVLGREHSEQELKDWITKKGFIMPFAADPKREIYSLFAKESIPRNVIIGRDGKIAFQNIGYTEEEFKVLEEKLAELLK